MILEHWRSDHIHFKCYLSHYVSDLITEEVITATLKVISAITKEIVATNKLVAATEKII